MKRLLLVCLFLPLLLINFLAGGERKHVYLANAFLKGSFSPVEPPTLSDFSYFDGKYYWPLGPFPAVILLPFTIIFKTHFSEEFIKFPLTIANFYMVYKMATSLKLQKEKAVYLALSFILGSVYTPVAAIPFSSYFAHIVATTLLLFSLLEFLNRRRWFLIGLTLACASLTRPTIITAVLFFLYFLRQKPNYFTNFFKFLVPLALATIFSLYYNYSRFGSIFDNGYKYQIIPQESAARRDSGIFSPKYIPANLYYFLIKSPDPVLDDKLQTLKAPFIKYNHYGMSIFLLSPILFFIFKTNLRETLVKASLLSSLVIFVPISLYYGIGWKQIGYRYSLDFFPFLLIALIFALKKTSLTKIKALTILGILITWFFINQAFSGL